jgi:polysaccharide chain length determinant protein (PEP-CTERM system associated)
MISIHEQINVLYGYLHGLWKYRWSSLLVAWTVAIGGWVYVYSLPDQFSAKAAVHIDTSSVMQPLLRGLAVDTNPEGEINVMTRILLSRENLLEVIRETDMDLNIHSPQAREAMVQSLASGIKLNNLGSRRRGANRSSIYEISYASSSAQYAFKVVFNLLNTLIENTLNSGRMDTVLAEEFLDEQIGEYEARLEAAEELLAEFKKKNVGFMPSEKGGYYTRLRQQQEIIDNTTSRLRLAKQTYNELRRQLSGESQLVGSSGYSKASIAKLRNMQERLNDMLTQFTDEHPDVRALRARIADLQAGNDPDTLEDPLLLNEEDAALNPVYQDLKAQESRARIDVSTLQVQLAEQRQKLAELEASVDIIPQVEADLSRLNRDYSITKERYLTLVERRENARMAQKIEQNNSQIIFRVVDAPVVPLLPSGPDRPVMLIAAFLAALGAGVGWSIFRFMLFPTFVDFKQLQKLVDFPVLGAISLQVTPEKRRQRRIHLVTYLLVVMLMLGMFGGVVMYQQQGSAQVRTLLAAFGNF